MRLCNSSNILNSIKYSKIHVIFISLKLTPCDDGLLLFPLKYYSKDKDFFLASSPTYMGL